MGGTVEYVLGTSDHELARLGLQQEVWGAITSDFLDRVGVLAGQRALDLGCGPGFVVEMLRERVGAAGEVIGLDESPRWIQHVERRIAERGWDNVRALEGRAQEVQLEPASLDLVFLRWVLGFLPERTAVLRRLARALRPGGLLAVMDYNHEGVSLFPESAAFRAVIRATRELYATRGGDTWTMGAIPAIFRRAGLDPFVLEPYVIAGGPGSPAFRWADAFFPFHTEGMVAQGVLGPQERERFLAEWQLRKADPNAIFFSPIVVGAAARRPG